MGEVSVSGVIAPLNRSGDLEGSRRSEDGTVTTPAGFPGAYRRYADAGWPAVPFPPAMMAPNTWATT